MSRQERLHLLFTVIKHSNTKWKTVKAAGIITAIMLVVKSRGSSNEGGKGFEGKPAVRPQPNKQIKMTEEHKWHICHNKVPPLSRGLDDGRPHGNATHPTAVA